MCLHADLGTRVLTSFNTMGVYCKVNDRCLHADLGTHVLISSITMRVTHALFQYARGG